MYQEAERVQWDDWVKSRGSPSSSTILEKLKSLCSLRRFHLVPLKEAGETAHQHENEAGTGRI